MGREETVWEGAVQYGRYILILIMEVFWIGKQKGCLERGRKEVGGVWSNGSEGFRTCWGQGALFSRFMWHILCT